MDMRSSRHVRKTEPRRPETSGSLVFGSGPELHYQFGWHPAAVLHLDALRPAPLADLGAAHPAGRCPASTPRWPPHCTHVARQRIPQRLGMPGVQVDLIVGAVQAEADGALSLAAIKVIDEQGLYLMGHGCSIPFTDLISRHESVKAQMTAAAS